jgi:hypothetical protein
VQAAKQSLQHMHDTDMLKLFSQSVQDVLAHKVGAQRSAKHCQRAPTMLSYTQHEPCLDTRCHETCWRTHCQPVCKAYCCLVDIALALQEPGSMRGTESALRTKTDAGHGLSAGAAAGTVLEADTSLQVLLAAKTTQEADAILAEKFDTTGNAALEPSLEALLSRSTSRTQGAAGSVGGESSLGGGASFVNNAGPGSAAADKLAAEVEHYKQQLAELQQELTASAAGSQEHVAKLEAQLQATGEEKAAAQAAQQELQQQKAAAEEAQQQLLLQINVLTQEAAQLKQLSNKWQEAQAADADLLAQTAVVQRELDETKRQWQAVQMQNAALQQQADRVAGLEAEVAKLQQQLQELLSHRASVHDAWTEADVISTGGNTVNRSTAGSSAAVSAVRAATHNLLLQSNPFEVSQRHALLLAGICHHLASYPPVQLPIHQHMQIMFTCKLAHFPDENQLSL